jgi:hypothetical protein
MQRFTRPKPSSSSAPGKSRKPIPASAPNSHLLKDTPGGEKAMPTFLAQANDAIDNAARFLERVIALLTDET